MKIFYKTKALYYRVLSKCLNNRKRGNSVTERGLHLLYRTSDAGYPKDKPEYINQFDCLINALTRFDPNEVDWHIMLDNCSEASRAKIYEICDNFKVNREQIYIESVGHGAGTFRLMYELIFKFPENDIVYFLENDYIHRENSYKSLMTVFYSGINVDYVTLYDHPDKYIRNYEFSWLIRKSAVYFDGLNYWRKTPSTTMTFAARVKTLKKDKRVFWRWTSTKHPYDFLIFLNLKNRTMLSPMPALSTHGETQWLSPLINWEKEINNTSENYKLKTDKNFKEQL